MSIDIEDKDMDSSVTPLNGNRFSSASDVKIATPTGAVKRQLPFVRNDTTETWIHSTKSIQLMTSSPRKKTPRTPPKQHHTLTSINKPKDKFTRLDEHDELEFMYSNYFDIRESS